MPRVRRAHNRRAGVIARIEVIVPRFNVAKQRIPARGRPNLGVMELLPDAMTS